MVCALGEIRITIPKKLHQDLNIRAVKEGKTLKDLAIELFERGEEVPISDPDKPCEGCKYFRDHAMAIKEIKRILDKISL